jgi:hypothetical protein
MAKLGDVRKCSSGHDAILRRIPENTASFGEGQPIVTPAHYAWVCTECGEERIEDDVEEAIHQARHTMKKRRGASGRPDRRSPRPKRRGKTRG